MPDRSHARDSARRATTIVQVGAALPAVVLALILVAFSWIAAIVVLVVVYLALFAWLRQGGLRMAVSGLEAAPTDPTHDARLINLVEGLCAGAGLRKPQLLVSPDPTCNLLVAGHGPDDAVLVVTRGLLDHLSVIELEGVLAEGLVQIRQGDIAPATVAVATFGLALRFLPFAVDRDEVLDQAAAALTLYPPALARALDTMAKHGTEVAAARPATARLWLADPRPAAVAATSGRLALPDRADALREL